MCKPMIDIVDNKEEQKYLLGGIIVPENRGSASIFDQLSHLEHMLINMPTTWSLMDIPLNNGYTILCGDKYGKWSHGIRDTGTHYNLGMAFAWYMLFKYIFIKIELTDSPDFHTITKIKSTGNKLKINISGDIGKCTTIAIMQGLQRLENIHDLWISVLDWSTILVIEFLYNPSTYYNYKLRTRTNSSKLLPFHLNDFTDKELSEIFYCAYCKDWTIDNESLKELKFSTWE